MPIRSAIFVGILLLLGFGSLAFNEPKSKVRKYNTKNGFPLKVINSITQGKNGLMWFGAQDGLARFDGYSFKVFKNDPDNPTSLSNNFIQCVYTDSEGTLWAASLTGLNRFDEKTEQFIRYEHSLKDKNTLVGTDVAYIHENPQGNLWLASYAAGFTYFDKKKATFLRYSQANLPRLSSREVICLYEDKYGLLWVGTQDGGLNVFEVTDGKVTKKVESLSGQRAVPSINIKCITSDHLGNIWIGTTEGLSVYDRKKNTFALFNTQNSALKGNIIRSLGEDSEQNLWVGVEDKGLHKLSLRSLEGESPLSLVVKQVTGEDEYSLYKRSIHAIFQDRDQNLWLGTNGEGIQMISGTKEPFARIQKKQTGEYEGSYVRFWGMCSDEEGNLWLGSDGDGIYKARADGQVLKHYKADGQPGSLTDNAILCAFRDQTNTLWFGTYAKGLFRYNKSTDSFTNYQHDPTNPASLQHNDVRVIFEDSRHRIWIGTNNGGLHLLNKSNGTFTVYTTSNSKLAGNDIRTIVEDKKGGLWLGTYGAGVSYFDPSTGQFQRYFDQVESKSYLASNIVYALCLDKENRLWMGTEGGGVAIYDPVTRALQQFNEKKGLGSSTVYALQEDWEGNMWMSTNEGLSKFDRKERKFYSYDALDGVQNGQFNSCSFLYEKRTGLMGFAGTEGVTVFYPAQVTQNLRHPAVLLTGFQLFNKPIEAGTAEGKKVLDEVINLTKEITLRYDQSVFTLEFAALEYAYPEKNKYAYQLEGLDRDWNYVGNQRTATYRYLEPGTYTFKVKASNQDTSWSPAYTAVTLTILPPFWRTPLAYFLYLSVIALAVFWVVAYQRKQARLKHKLLVARTLRKKERQLVGEKLSFFTEVSHEFRTPLTLMLGPLEEMLSQEGKYTPTGKKLKMVYRNAHRLLNLINKLLDYRKAETGNMVLKVKEENIVSFVEEIYVTFKEMATRKNINFTFESSEPTIPLWFDKEKLEMVLNNIISNSFKYIGSGNEVTLSIRAEAPTDSATVGQVCINVKDNGIGISKTQLKYVFDWFYQGDNANPMSSGIGLALAKKLIELHKGRVFAESTEGKGSTFGFRMPLGKEHFSPSEVIYEQEVPAPLLPEPTSEPEMVLAADSEERTSTKGLRKILIVEDDEEIRLFLRGYLEKTFHLFEATQGEEGLAMALVHHPDVIISDIMMPVMNGIDLCKEIKSNLRTSHIPVILLTARTSFTHHKEGLEIGADAYITKPFSPDLLVMHIQNLLQSRENTKRFYRHLLHSNEQPVKVEGLRSPDEQFLEKIYELLKANLDNPDFNVNEMADSLSMSRSVFYKKVKMLTGIAPLEYLRSLRMQEAARLLKTKQYKVFEVVYMVGFTDLKYFRQCFTKEFGYAPSEYIKMPQTNEK